MKSSDEFQLTQEDKGRYEERISEIDLNDIPMVLKKYLKKLKNWYLIRPYSTTKLF